MSMTFPRTLLLFAAAWALYALWIVPYQNGLLTSMLELQKPATYLPGSGRVATRHHYTGFQVVDNQISTMVAFFWPALDGSRADISLVFLEIITQAMATWVLVTIESLRLGNSGKWYINSVTIAGLLMQNAGYGLIVPVWLYLHLAFSPTINKPLPRKLMASNPLPLSTLPLSTILAFFIPNFLMSLRPGHALCADTSTKQFYTAVSQFWPILLGGLQIILPIIISVAIPGINTLSEENKKVKSLKYLRRCYAFALISTTCSHLVSFGIPLLAYIAPSLIGAPYLSQLELSNMFVLRSPLPPVQSITSIADGVLSFVQWDLLIGSVSVLVWAVTLRVKAQGRGFDGFEWIDGLVKVLGLVCLSGPVGAAVAVVWERDEHVFARVTELEDEEESDEERKNR